MTPSIRSSSPRGRASRSPRVETCDARHIPPGEFGKVIGLDRVPEVRTLREKIAVMAATGDPGAFSRATSGITAASYCSGPSIARSGRAAFAIFVASLTFSTSSRVRWGSGAISPNSQWWGTTPNATARWKASSA